MNNIPTIRKNSYKEYLTNGVVAGLVAGLILFFGFLIDNTILTSLWIGLSIGILIILIFVAGFIREEYFRRKAEIRRLRGDKYAFLHDNGFILHEELYFEGVYKEYHIKVLPMTQWRQFKKDIKYNIIEAFYALENELDLMESEEKMSDKYYIGNLFFNNCCVSYIPKDWETPDFEANFEGLISILKRKGLEPLTKENWNTIYGKKLEEARKHDEESRTRQLLKIGKILDIKYIKKPKQQ